MRTVAAVALVALVSSGCAWIARVSVDSAGAEADSSSDKPAISANGRYITFFSEAPNLVAGDTNGESDVFVHDTVAGTTSRVSVDNGGTQANSDSALSAISADGRYITFQSFASNLVAGDGNGVSDVFVRDTVAGTTSRVSVDSAGSQADGGSSSRPAISADGRYITFASLASNLVAGDTNNGSDVFVRDTVAGTTSRVSVDSAGTETNNVSTWPVISADGRYIVFTSAASNLVSGDGNGLLDVFVRDTTAGTTTRVSVDTGSGDANGRSGEIFLPIASGGVSISGGGRYIAFVSDASNLIVGDTNGKTDVFVRDTVIGATSRVSVDTTGTQANSNSIEPAISDDGRYIAFWSAATNLVAGDTNNANDVFVRDTVIGATSRVSVDLTGTQGNTTSGIPAISADGRYITFPSLASNLVTGDTNGEQDILVRANPQPDVTAVAPATLPRGATTPITVTGTGFLASSILTVGGDGITLTNVTVVSSTQITADITVDAGAPVGARDMSVLLAGTGPGPIAGAMEFCFACVTVT